jgi:hypothetical protein
MGWFFDTPSWWIAHNCTHHDLGHPRAPPDDHQASNHHWSPRVTSINSHLTKTSPMRKVNAHFYSLCTNEVLNLGLSNLNHRTWLLLYLALQSVSSANKWARELSWTGRKSIYTPHFKTYPLGSNSAHFKVTGCPCQSDRTHPVSSQWLQCCQPRQTTVRVTGPSWPDVSGP